MSRGQAAYTSEHTLAVFAGPLRCGSIGVVGKVYGQRRVTLRSCLPFCDDGHRS